LDIENSRIQDSGIRTQESARVFLLAVVYDTDNLFEAKKRVLAEGGALAIRYHQG
jgi:hypothetical protein